MRDANAEVEWTPEYMGKRMDDWLVNMGDWNISRRRYYGLPLPFYPCACGHLNVIGSKAELEERALGGLDQLEELRRPWIDDVPIRCEQCGEEVRRIPEVGDVWLDAGIVPFSTLGWQNPEYVPEGYATGAAKGLTTADLPDHAYWEEWFPADWVSEMREQIRLWFYSQHFMSVALTGRAPYQARARLREDARRDGPRDARLVGEHDRRSGGVRAHGRGRDALAVLRPAARPEPALRLRAGAGDQAQAADALELGPLPRRLRDDRGLPARVRRGAAGERPLDRWLVARTEQLVAEATAGYDAFLTVNVTRAFEEFVEDVSNWYIRRSRRRFWDGEEEALQALWHALVQGIRVVAPVMPFLAEHLWQSLVRGAGGEPPQSVHLAGWPDPGTADQALLDEVAELRRVVGLGHQARAAAQLKLRQPLRRLVVEGAPLAEGHAEELREELRVKEVEFGHVDATELHVKPHLPVLGPKLGKELGAVRAALAAGEFEQLDGGGFRVLGHDLGADEVLVERSGKSGWAVASDEGVTVALDTAVDPELELEGRVYDLIHTLNSMRKDQGLELTDRIAVTLPAADADLVERHAEWIKAEVLAVSLDTDGVASPGSRRSSRPSAALPPGRARGAARPAGGR